AALAAIKEQINIPLVADVHFDYRLALDVLDMPIDKLRINPGNIGGEEKFSLVIAKARQKMIPVRLGINAGSLESVILEKWGGPGPEAMAEEAFNYIKIAENCSFNDLVISVKAADVVTCIKAYRLIAEKTGYPLHIGITEAGSFLKGAIKSAIGLGYLLLEGIGDTLRVSLTGNPVEEIQVAKDILQGVGIRQFGPEIISCPTCGRCGIDLISLVKEVEARVAGIKEPIKIAVMGCAVNGPGEARQADYGIAGGKGSGLIFKKGVVVKKVPEAKLVDALLEMIAERDRGGRADESCGHNTSV
ncbi:MAG TPA: flavodoxin-dependent (E)-4-hydroxy-3-methylbut-2-enyl-diphosphate synthase, partial [Firmicutes bacterium]|nr:flavodoxin-dependent (E)-4-hydroxy-3-methylbut-2-enyl-diphosphate synthase [Bacillota bacterium]